MPTSLAALARALFGRRWRKGLICVVRADDMLKSFIDESMSQNPADVTVVVACVSTGERWGKFEDEWLKTLKPFGTRVFRTTDYLKSVNTGKGRYGRLKKDKHDRKTFERRLARIIKDNIEVCFAEAVPEQVYRAEIAPNLYVDAKGVYGDSYYFCLMSCLARTHFARQPGRRNLLPDRRVLTFAENRSNKQDERLRRQYDRLRKDHFPNFGPILIGRKEDQEMIGCQAADWTSHGVMQHMRKGFAGATLSRGQARLTARIVRGPLHGVTFIKANLLRSFVKTALLYQQRVDRGEVEPGSFPARLEPI